MKKLNTILLISLFYFLFSNLQKSVFAKEEPNEEIIYPQGSPVCTDFEIQYSNSYSELIATRSSVQSAQESIENLQGESRLNNSSFPDFSEMNKNLDFALQRLLPQELKEKLKIEEKNLSSENIHFVLGKDNQGQELIPQKPAKTIINFPSWWSKLIGQTKVTCGIFGTCDAPKSFNIKIANTKTNIKETSYLNKCNTIGNGTKPETVSLDNYDPLFKTKSLFSRIIEFFEQVVDEIKNIIARYRKTEEKTTLVQKTRGELPGGKSFQTFSDFQRAYIPQKLTEEWQFKTGASKNPSEFNIIILSKSKNYNPNLYWQEMEKEKFKRCIFLCSLYPAGFDISSIDPLCSSCNPHDYKIDYIEVDKTNCHITSSGCDYYTCLLGTNYQDPITKENKKCQTSCEGDPICESGKCYHNMFRASNDYTDRGCPLPYNSNACNLKEICIPMTFKKNPNGGFGPCQYQNPNVCIRADWNQTGVARCDYLCNWACCAYQKK